VSIFVYSLIFVYMKKKQYATGGQLTKAINNNFYPTGYTTPMLGFGDFLKDSALLYGDYMLSAFGGKNMISDDMYSNKGFAKASNIVSGVSEIGGKVAAGVVAPGIGDKIVGGVQQGVGAAVPDRDAQNQEKLAYEQMMAEQQKQQMLQTFAQGGFMNSIPTKPLKTNTKGTDELDNMPRLSEKELYNLNNLSRYYSYKAVEDDMIDNYQSQMQDRLMSDPLRDIVNTPTNTAKMATGGSLSEEEQNKKANILARAVYAASGGPKRRGIDPWKMTVGQKKQYDNSDLYANKIIQDEFNKRPDSSNKAWNKYITSPEWQDRRTQLMDSLLQVPDLNFSEDRKGNTPNYEEMWTMPEFWINKFNKNKATGGILDSYGCGGMMKKAMGGSLQPDNITLYKEGGSHETNMNGGIPIGNKARVEEGEVRFNSKKYGDYIFTDRY
jgi:hypothetical protein